MHRLSSFSENFLFRFSVDGTPPLESSIIRNYWCPLPFPKNRSMRMDWLVKIDCLKAPFKLPKEILVPRLASGHLDHHLAIQALHQRLQPEVPSFHRSWMLRAKED
ncbi:hypothetical protein P8452_77840 [Trifolium repens]|nr:hypothetical protein P8452_77840 [Trifolium repens]